MELYLATVIPTTWPHMVDKDGRGGTGLTFVKSRRVIYQDTRPMRDAGDPKCRLEGGCQCSVAGPRRLGFDLEHRRWIEMVARA